MTLRSRAVLAAAAAVVLLASACDEPAAPTTPAQPPSTASPGSDPQTRLAREVAPAVWLADGETLMPMDASRFVADADLWFDHGRLCKDDEPVATDVTDTGLGRGEYSHPAASVPQPHSEDPLPCTHDEGASRYRTDSAERQSAGGGRGFYLDLDDGRRRGDGPNAPVYWQYVGEPGGAGAFVYWLFYGYNDFINNHEGDWERVAVRVDGQRPTGVTFWRHNEPTCFLPWDRVERAGDRPVTYAAKGSHGSYHREGTFPLATDVVADHTSPGTPWHTWDNLREVEKEPWWGYRGLWGVIGPEVLGASGIAGPNPDRNATVRSDALTSVPCSVDPRFIGKWATKEPVNQPSSDKVYHARISLRDGAIGDEVGTASYPGLECSGTLTLVENTPDKLVVREQITSDPRSTCVKQTTITLAVSGDTLLYSFTDPSTGTATLFRE